MPSEERPAPTPARFAGRTVLVTGAGGGVGRAIACLFGAAGAAVLVNDVVAEGCEGTVASIRESGGRAEMAVADIAEAAGAQSCVDAAIRAFGALDILVNNAAVITEISDFVDYPRAAMERDIRIGLLGTMGVTQRALPGMIARRHGRIVNIASDAGRAGNGRLASYSAAKGGVIAFTKAVAQEVGPFGITVNAVSPGSVRAPMRDQVLRDIGDRLGAEAVAGREEARLAQYPTRRIAEPDDIAQAVLFFAFDAASDITGQTLSVNGGFRMY